LYVCKEFVIDNSYCMVKTDSATVRVSNQACYRLFSNISGEQKAIDKRVNGEAAYRDTAALLLLFLFLSLLKLAHIKFNFNSKLFISCQHVCHTHIHVALKQIN